MATFQNDFALKVYIKIARCVQTISIQIISAPSMDLQIIPYYFIITRKIESIHIVEIKIRS